MLQKGDKKLLFGWAFYDWANSVYSLVISTAIFPIYYESVTRTDSGLVHFFGMEFNNTSLYSYALSFSFLLVAFISPVLSGIADYVGNKKNYMKFFCYLGAISVMMLFFFKGIETLWIGILFSVLASIGFWGSMVFYDAYLPEIAYNDQQDDVSAKGFIYGYIGSVILLLFNLSMVLKPELYHITDANLALRISFLTVGIWWIAFAQITFRILPKNIKDKKFKKNYFLKGLLELKKVIKELRDQSNLLNFLIAHFLYSIGVQSIILLAAIYGKTEIGLSTSNLIMAIIMIQLVGIIGAYFFSKLTKIIGNLTAIKITIVIWTAITFAAYFLNKNDPNVLLKFYVISGFLGLVLGAIQTLSRSTYSKLLPKDSTDHATYFSFFIVTEKIAIVWGTFIFGISISITGSMKISILLLSIFFVAGFIALSFMKKTEYVK
ncbi:MAG: MFS transporter [Flavobacteriaceae bacterium]|nr:MFS transporter [Flavobacteriaceae bacterium]